MRSFSVLTIQTSANFIEDVIPIDIIKNLLDLSSYASYTANIY